MILNEHANPDFAVAFKIGSWGLPWYSVFIFFGFLAAIIFSMIKLKYVKKVSVDPFYYYILPGVVAAIVGARLWDLTFSGQKVESFQQFIGYDSASGGITGLSVIGGVLFPVLLALIWFPWLLKKPKNMKKTDDGKVMRISMWVYADAIAPTILLGQVIGRWGNFFNGELAGNPVGATDLNWLKSVMPGVWDKMWLKDSLHTEIRLHPPMFLYESFFNFWGFLFIYVGMEFIKKLKAGTFSAAYAIWYGGLRAITEPFKEHDAGYHLAPYLAASIVMIIIGVILFVGMQFGMPKYRNRKIFFELRTRAVFAWQLFISRWSDKTKNRLNAVDPKRERFGHAFKPNFIKEEMYWAGR